jgi:hypothetical protein
LFSFGRYSSSWQIYVLKSIQCHCGLQ